MTYVRTRCYEVLRTRWCQYVAGMTPRPQVVFSGPVVTVV